MIDLPKLLARMVTRTVPRQTLQDTYTDGYIIVVVTHFARSRRWRSHLLAAGVVSKAARSHFGTTSSLSGKGHEA